MILYATALVALIATTAVLADDLRGSSNKNQRGLLAKCRNNSPWGWQDMACTADLPMCVSVSGGILGAWGSMETTAPNV
jgi:hypothetical protein